MRLLGEFRRDNATFSHGLEGVIKTRGGVEGTGGSPAGKRLGWSGKGDGEAEMVHPEDTDGIILIDSK